MRMTMKAKDLKVGMEFTYKAEGRWTDANGIQQIDWCTVRGRITKLTAFQMEWERVEILEVVHNSPTASKESLIPKGGGFNLKYFHLDKNVTF